jgi:hypothetical protein
VEPGEGSGRGKGGPLANTFVTKTKAPIRSNPKYNFVFVMTTFLISSQISPSQNMAIPQTIARPMPQPFFEIFARNTLICNNLDVLKIDPEISKL